MTTCINGDVRLVGGPSANEGRLELCYNGVWGSICGTYTPLQTSTVVCRQLGFDGTSKSGVESRIIRNYLGIADKHYSGMKFYLCHMHLST